MMGAENIFEIIALTFLVFTISGSWCTINILDDSKLIQEYTENKSIGRAYKIMYKAEPWHEAEENCRRDGAKLAVPKSADEFKFIQSLVRKMNIQSIEGAEKKHIVPWLGINNLDNYEVWKNVDGEDIKNTGFSKWATNYTEEFSSPDPREPHCAGLDAINYGLREFWCHLAQPYLCEKRI